MDVVDNCADVDSKVVDRDSVEVGCGEVCSVVETPVDIDFMVDDTGVLSVIGIAVVVVVVVVVVSSVSAGVNCDVRAAVELLLGTTP